MQATAAEFRFRMAIMTVVTALGFYAPWIEAWGVGDRIPLLEWLALELSRLGLLSFTVATPVVIVLGSLIAAASVVLRIWGTAWLGSATMLHPDMTAGSMTADGPYRYVRNPLYLGSWFMMAAMAFIMPPTGALFVMTLITIFLLRLILGEEAFLTAKFGQAYRDYLRAVPRLFPRLRTTLPRTGQKPQWLRAIIAELNPIGVFVTLAAVSWTYSNWLMIRSILISFGVSLVVRALLPGIRQGGAIPAAPTGLE